MHSVDELPSRPRLLDAPPAVVAAVEEMLGATVTAEFPAAGGFTMSIASVVMAASGRGRVFIKAGPFGEGLGEALAPAANSRP